MSAQPTNDTPAVAAAPAAAPASDAPAAVSTEAQPAAVAPTAEPIAPAVAPSPEQPKAEETTPAAQKTDEKPQETPAAAVEEEPAEKAKTPVAAFFEKLAGILEAAGHREMWGVKLTDDSHIPTIVVLQKFLRANDNDVSAAAEQLKKALEWRRDTDPGKLLDEVSFDNTKFGELGYVTTHLDTQGKETVITWNIYGAVKDKQATFGNVQEFIKWRAALMELSIRKLNLAKVESPIPDGGEDPYQMIQVHDYLNVSFLRMDPAVKKSSSETIRIFSMAYPELLKHKYFVNIPTLMGWVFKAMKVFLAPKTVSKFHPLGYGAELANEIPSLKQSLPKEYGGSAESIKATGQTVKLGDAVAAPASAPATEVKAEAKTEMPAATETKAVEAPATAPAPAPAAIAAATSTEPAPVAAAEPAKTDGPKEAAQVPNVADLSIKDGAEAKEAPKEEAKSAAA
ncbi:Phosphatidylinositol transfer protein sfh5 [Colletotrichum orbiculare MAFF 240422]|uniref:Phosphatidylinositol transfer protein SFH5 n=1 Tax=Colletotrichum orbiculare (strain 104-T / ATCC 96160 / CBS 514.97 / LARS 414 / MAFF 240422) TaxID=1213857 RepID=N4V9N7_COLOR|nr:Phosphatidylinositol transfer protein sfh5 [Colletotrichum orbiculare MAFF 240422]